MSGILSPRGSPAAVLRALLTERVRLCFDERILSEYRDVLHRGKFAFDRELVAEVLSFLEAAGIRTLAQPLNVALPDPEDPMFIEVAVFGDADFLVTGNLKHFPSSARHGIAVVSPRRFLEAVLRRIGGKGGIRTFGVSLYLDGFPDSVSRCGSADEHQSRRVIGSDTQHKPYSRATCRKGCDARQAQQIC